MIMKVKRDSELDYMVEACFGFQRSFFKSMEELGNRIVDRDQFEVIEHKLKDNREPHLNTVEAKMFAGLVDATNMSLLDIKPPYRKEEMRFFGASQSFMDKYNAWVKENGRKV